MNPVCRWDHQGSVTCPKSQGLRGRASIESRSFWLIHDSEFSAALPGLSLLMLYQWSPMRWTWKSKRFSSVSRTFPFSAFVSFLLFGGSQVSSTVLVNWKRAVDTFPAPSVDAQTCWKHVVFHTAVFYENEISCSMAFRSLPKLLPLTGANNWRISSVPVVPVQVTPKLSLKNNILFCCRKCLNFLWL